MKKPRRLVTSPRGLPMTFNKIKTMLILQDETTSNEMMNNKNEMCKEITIIYIFLQR